MTVRDAAGKPGVFTPWYGAMGHAIFFRAARPRLLPHPHLRAQAGRVREPGRPDGDHRQLTQPGVMHVGVLLPEAGTWRLFLQCKVHGHILTAPFTLKVQ